MNYWNSSLYAQHNDGNLFSLSLLELSQTKITIANRTEENFIEAPSSVTVISRQEIEQLGVRTLTELLNYVPGFQSYMSSHESNGSLILSRGLASIYGQNLLLMIDGHRINDEYTGGFTFADHLLSLYNVKQVEFIRGPGSALYGSNACSGVINIITGKRQGAGVTVGSNGARGINASAFGQSGQLASSVALNYFQDDGQSYRELTAQNGFNQSTQDPVQVFEARAGMSYQRSRVIVEYIDTRLDNYYVFRRINNGINQNDSQRFGVYAEHEFTLGLGWKGSGRLGYMRHERYLNTLLSPTDTDPFILDWQQDTREAQLDFSKVTQSGHQISLGTYLGKMEIPLAFLTEVDPFVLDKSRRTLGIYAQDQFDLTHDLRLTAGLRYDHYSDFGGSLNPRLALLYRWRDNDFFKLMYGQAYRAPSLGDLYDKKNVISDGNLFLDPVTVKTLEFAYLHSEGDNHLIITWFYNDYHDFITTRSTPTGTLYDNVYDNQAQGLELDYRNHISEHWSTRLGITHITSSMTTSQPGVSISEPEALSPTTYGNVQLNFQQSHWNGNINAIFHDGIAVLQDQGALVVLNSKLIYRLKKHWKLGANIRNIFDKPYSTPQIRSLGQSPSNQTIQQMPSREREYFISLQYAH